MSADRRRLQIGVLAVLTLALAAGAAGARVRALLADDVINACTSLSTGALRVPAAGGSCKADEQPLRWNVRGPTGATGPQGPPGPVSVDFLAGTTCTTAAGSVGSLGVRTNPKRGRDFQLSRTSRIRRPGQGLILNEIDYDQVGPDTGGFVELFDDAGAPPTWAGSRSSSSTARPLPSTTRSRSAVR